jgi:hypothetical protein
MRAAMMAISRPVRTTTHMPTLISRPAFVFFMPLLSAFYYTLFILIVIHSAKERHLRTALATVLI